jgi:RNA polymerase sigma-70 factor (family 1)
MTTNQTADKIQELFDEYYIGLVEFCSRIIHCTETSRDIVQDIFVKLLDSSIELPREKAVLRSYLYSMVRNASLNYLRREKLFHKYKQANDHSAFSDEDVLEAIIYGETIQQLHHAIQSLPAACRNICELTYLEEHSNQEAAKLSETTINTVKTHKRRAVALLREQILTLSHLAKSILFLFF